MAAKLCGVFSARPRRTLRAVPASKCGAHLRARNLVARPGPVCARWAPRPWQADRCSLPARPERAPAGPPRILQRQATWGALPWVLELGFSAQPVRPACREQLLVRKLRQRGVLACHMLWNIAVMLCIACVNACVATW